MIGIAFRFAAGEHPVPFQDSLATEIEWPPSPWRLMCVIAAAAARVHIHSAEAERTLESLVEALSLEPPRYTLPSCAEIGRRGSGLGAESAVLRVSRPSVLHIHWPHLSLRPDELELLEQILAQVPAACSAEEWLTCDVSHEPPARVDARPLRPAEGAEGAEGRGQVVMWLCPLPPHVWPESQVHSPTAGAGAGLLEALAADVRPVSGGAPAAARRVRYVFADPALRKPRRSKRTYRQLAAREQVNAARYAIAASCRPRVTEALDIAEVFHQSILSRYDDRAQPAPLIITGHEPNEPGAVSRRGHQHVFVLPEDLDLDGLLDHVLIYAQDPFPEGVIAALERIRTLVTPDWWPGPKRRWRVSLEDLWRVPEAADGSAPMPEDLLIGPGRIFLSITPYLHPWHAKHGGAKFGPIEQIRKELRLRGLPEPVSITPLAAAHVAGQLVPAHKFRRLRYGKRQNIPGRWGSFWRLEFAEPVYGPIALGANCHFGMGLFAVEVDEADRAYGETEDAEMT
ncbi:type I-U CRISPR-associated protein Csb2 [Alicyclobacillus fructus]|uniref:type I-G CRISPR-associated protein Csb2 n=1 Tax=Alicyclobacillus fructus TaxID=2816082 RepID=UPI001A8F8C47|nr:type I-U CRISPR-associated protein Csb2 [Alicyclobacillus fructus]